MPFYEYESLRFRQRAIFVDNMRAQIARERGELEAMKAKFKPGGG